MVPSPWPWLWGKLKQEWNEAELANEAHRRGEDWLNDECFLYEEGKYDRPLRHLGKRDASGKFCNVGGKFVPMDAPLREVGGDLVPATTQQAPQTPASAVPAPPVPSPAATPPPASPSAAEPVKSSRSKTNRSSRRAVREAEPELLTEVAERPQQPQSQLPYPSEQPPAPRAQPPSLGESAKQFARGFAHGVGAESLQIYNDTKELPSQLAKTGREILEDIHANRRVRALAPLVAMEHAIRNASRKDVERIAHAVVDGAKEWLDKPAYEKGESLGRATTAIASEVAIDVLTDGLGSVALLRKVEKVADAADHVRDAASVGRSTTTVLSDVTVVSKGKVVGRGNVHLRPTLEKIENGNLVPRDTFTNREGLLPSQPPGYYKEYVHPTEGVSGPGSQRIVRGAGGEMYYTPDHYKTFVPLNGSSSP